MARVVSGAFGEYILVDELSLKGGGGKLFEIRGRPDLLYKHFNDPYAGKHVKRIIDLVDVGRQIGGRRDMSRARHIAWPIDLEIERGKALGVVIPRAGEEYFCSGTTVLIPQNFGHLAGATKDPPSVKPRLMIVSQLAGALDLLDEQHLVQGDVSGSNMLWTTEPDPSLLLVDCDGIRPRDFCVNGAGTPGWTDPRLKKELIRCHDAQSDWYALALAIYRATVLSFREIPSSRDFDWIGAELPSPIAQRVIQVFSDPLDAAARVPPEDWDIALRSVIDDEAQCRQIESVNRERPTTVAARRAASNLPRRRARQTPKPASPSDASRQSAGGSVPSNPQRSLYYAGHKKSMDGAKSSARGRARRRLLTVVTLFVLATFASYHFTGLPNWPILNTLNLFLSSSQRDLVAALPSGIHHCSGDRANLPAGTVAAVTCEWEDRDIVAIRFSSIDAMYSFYKKRAAIAQRTMAKESVPSNCPKPGRWHAHSGKHTLGEMIFFTSTTGARIDWYRNSSLIYFVGLGSQNDLDGLCSWWTELDS